MARRARSSLRVSSSDLTPSNVHPLGARVFPRPREGQRFAASSGNSGVRSSRSQEPNLLGARSRARAEVVPLEQATQHRPVLVALRFLGLNQVGERHHLALGAVRQLNRVAPRPKPGERVHASHARQDVDPHAQRFWVLAAEVNVSAAEVLRLERRHGDHRRLQIGEGPSQAREVGGASEYGEVGVAAELGCAVQNAGLATHQQRAHPSRFDRRKDCAYRVRDQAILRGRGTSATASRSPGSAAAGRGRTSRPIPGLPRPRRAPW